MAVLSNSGVGPVTYGLCGVCSVSVCVRLSYSKAVLRRSAWEMHQSCGSGERVLCMAQTPTHAPCIYAQHARVRLWVQPCPDAVVGVDRNPYLNGLSVRHGLRLLLRHGLRICGRHGRIPRRGLHCLLLPVVMWPAALLRVVNTDDAEGASR